MDDIGMSPDYRSGVDDDAQECHVCNREMPGAFVDACYCCGKPTCKACINHPLSGWFCVECAGLPQF